MHMACVVILIQVQSGEKLMLYEREMAPISGVECGPEDENNTFPPEHQEFATIIPWY